MTTFTTRFFRNSILRRSFVFAICCSLLSLPAFGDDPDENAPKRLTRAESFFGVHFDFHAGQDNKDIGANTTPEMVQTIIDRLHPDFIQVDSKGHPGWTSYPTKVGNAAPGIVADSLKVWRDVTAKNGVALYLHHSGVWDTQAVTAHPEWAVVESNGERSSTKTSVFGEYKDKLLIPQLLEMALDYHVDGVWVDGECWATLIDYSDAAKEAFRKETGIENIPTAPGQPGWNEWFSFHQEAFRKYLRDYTTAVKAKAPNFQIASNWAFTDHMAEDISVDVDFISGDFSPNDSVTAARYSTRLMEQQGAAWDLMAWSFGGRNGEWNDWVQKNGVQLSREAACVLAQGGSFQAYITQNPDGSVNLDKLDGMEETGKFCRARQSLCQGSKSIPQVALFCPTAAHYQMQADSNGALFPMITWQRPILKRLLEKNYSVNILLDSKLTQKIDDYPVAVFYRGGKWSDGLKDAVVKYVKQGGSIVLVGNEPLDEMRDVIKNAERIGGDNKDNVWFLDFYRLEKGSIVVYPTPVGSPKEFVNASGETFNQFLAEAMGQAFPDPFVRFAQAQPLDVSIRQTKDGKTSIHLVNVSGPHEQAGIIETIDPVENVELEINLSKRPKELRLEPSGVALDFDWKDGKANVTIPSIPIYEIVVIDEE